MPKARRPDEISFFVELNENHGDEAVQCAKKILDWANSRGMDIHWGGVRQVTFYPSIRHRSQNINFFSVSTRSDQVCIESFNFRDYAPFHNEEERSQLLEKLNAIPGTLSKKKSLTTRYFKVMNLYKCDARSRQELLDVFDWVIQEIKAA